MAIVCCLTSLITIPKRVQEVISPDNLNKQVFSKGTIPSRRIRNTLIGIEGCRTQIKTEPHKSNKVLIERSANYLNEICYSKNYYFYEVISP